MEEQRAPIEKSNSNFLRENLAKRKTAPKEVSVALAARELSVSERTVLNLIRQKKIHAVKVGKCWYVDLASVLAHAQAVAYGRSEDSEDSEKNFSPEDRPGIVVQNLPRPVNTSKGGSLLELNCYRIALDMFYKEATQTEQVLKTKQAQTLEERTVQLKLRILESLGAGYHSFGTSKLLEYGKARSAAGSLLALLFAASGNPPSENTGISFLKEKLLPALVALHRTAEKRHHL